MDVKQKLKESRTFIKNKQFTEAIESCKLILNEEPDNYLALVFLGLAQLETEQTEGCEQVFRRAIELKADYLLAWRGLAKYLEKYGFSQSKQELIKIYTFLFDHETNEERIPEHSHKLCQLYKEVQQKDILQFLIKKSGNFSRDTRSKINQHIAETMNENADLDEDTMNIYEETLESISNDCELISPEYYSHYLNILHRLKKFRKFQDLLLQMYKEFPENLSCMSWVCRNYNENYVEGYMLEVFNIEDISQNLLNADPENTSAKFSIAIRKFENGDNTGARVMITEIIQQNHNLVHAWIFLSKINNTLHLYEEAIESAEFALRLIKSPFSSTSHLRNLIEYCTLEALSRSPMSSRWKQTITRFEKLDHEFKHRCLPHFIRAHIKLEHFRIAETSLNQLSSDPAHEILRYELLIKQTKHEEVIKSIDKETCTNAELLLELGIANLELKKFDQALNCLLKSAKADPHNFYCFYHLGRCYLSTKQFDKSRRCLEKSFKLCPQFVESARELSCIYRLLKNTEENQKLLLTLMEGSPNSENSWAWLQMGLHLNEEGHNDDAIRYLRCASRHNPTNPYFWESLGDAYLSRGSYTSAQKAYERCLAITDDVVYPLLQIATIKKDLGDYDGAILDFEVLLRKGEKSVLVLSGLAEVNYKKGKLCYSEQRFGTVRDYVQKATDAATSAIKLKHDVSCLWKIFGDCCMLVTNLPETNCCLIISNAVYETADSEGDVILAKDELFELAEKCYSIAVLIFDNHLIWHDLAVCCFSHAKYNWNKNPEIFEKLMDKSLNMALHCTTTNPKYWQHWNLLGTIAMHMDPPNYALAQHAFIYAIHADHNCACAWSNLGVLYSLIGRVVLANRAFAEAQRADPSYVQSWIGQGLLAELLGRDEDAMDLFRHAESTQFHPQGAIAYADWVCRKLTEKIENSELYVIKDLHAIPVACDGLTWYIEKNSHDACAWNMLGILRERMGLMCGAEEAFEKAMLFTLEDYSDMARINYGRILTRLGNCEKAARICEGVQESTFESGIWYALALFKGNRLRESSSIYIAIAEHLATEEHAVGDVVACMAIQTYALNEPDFARQMIVQSLPKRTPSAAAMYALIALAVLAEDKSLMDLMLNKLDSLADLTKNIENFAMLTAYISLRQGKMSKAVRKISELIHMVPQNAELWLNLALTLLSHAKVDTANKVAKTAFELRDNGINYRTMAKIYCTNSTSSLLIGDQKSALISAQKALHCHPCAKESWIVFRQALQEDPKRDKILQSMDESLMSNEDTQHFQNSTVF